MVFLPEVPEVIQEVRVHPAAVAAVAAVLHYTLDLRFYLLPAAAAAAVAAVNIAAGQLAAAAG